MVNQVQHDGAAFSAKGKGRPECPGPALFESLKCPTQVWQDFPLTVAWVALALTDWPPPA
jgi:hypothetical protein